MEEGGEKKGKENRQEGRKRQREGKMLTESESANDECENWRNRRLYGRGKWRGRRKMELEQREKVKEK